VSLASPLPTKPVPAAAVTMLVDRPRDEVVGTPGDEAEATAKGTTKTGSRTHSSKTTSPSAATTASAKAFSDAAPAADSSASVHSEEGTATTTPSAGRPHDGALPRPRSR
jgi:hypothetical protein